jgi:hypothetical protein
LRAQNPAAISTDFMRADFGILRLATVRNGFYGIFMFFECAACDTVSMNSDPLLSC